MAALVRGTAGEAAFRDEDGTPVSAVLTLDQDRALFELDLFKADNSPRGASRPPRIWQ